MASPRSAAAVGADDDWAALCSLEAALEADLRVAETASAERSQFRGDAEGTSDGTSAVAALDARAATYWNAPRRRSENVAPSDLGMVARPRGRGRRRISERRRDVVSLPLGEDRRTPPITARTATTRTDCCTAPGASRSARAWATRRCRRLTRPARLSSPSTMSSGRGFSPRVPQIRRDARVRRRRERLPRRRERHSSRRITRFRLRRRGNWRRRRRHRRERAIPNG